ncbi:MAG: adenylate/guanylate cyclase domain-containing protein [Saprospiraceae bacterium]|nr:adenylate/guanylate cyclase domain-containing protein [Saprospiraceae bacterium]
MRNYKTNLFYTFFCLFIVLPSYASNLDSLKTLLQGRLVDTAKIDLLIKMSSELLGVNNDSSIVFSKIAVQLADSINHPEKKAYALKNVGLGYYYKGEFLEVLNFWEKSLATFRLIQNQAGISNLLGNLGAVFFNQGDNVKALQYYLEALEISEVIKNELRTATLLVNIGLIYMERNELPLAEEYFQKTLVLAKKINYSDAIGTASINLGDINVKKKDYQKATEYLNIAIATFKEANNTAICEALRLFAEINIIKGLYDEALKYLNEGLSFAEVKAAKYEQAKLLNTKADAYFHKKEYQESLNLYTSAIKISKEIASNSELKVSYEGVTKIYLTTKKFDKAVEAQTLLMAVKDSINSSAQDEKISELNLLYEMNKKETENQLLNRDIELKQTQIARSKLYQNFLLAVGLFLLITVGGVTYSYTFARKTNKIITNERNKSDALLLNILPKETAEELKTRGMVVPKQLENVTVLFTDFVGFSRIAEHTNADALVNSLNYYFSYFDEIINKYQLEKIKTIGDAYMCAGGIKSTNTNVSVNAMNTAIEILEWVNSIKEQKPEGIELFDIRIGLASGPVIAGIVGKTKFQFDIWGDTVNIAARMEQASNINKINVAESVYNQVKDYFNFEYRGEIDAKNRGQLIMYHYLSKKTEQAS